MAAAPRGVCVGVPIVLVPHRSHIPRVCFEEQLRHRVEPFGRLLADGARLIDRRLIEWQLDFDDGAAAAALKIVAGH
jgi:hypothetical protein